MIFKMTLCDPIFQGKGNQVTALADAVNMAQC